MAVSLPNLHTCGLRSCMKNVYALISGRQILTDYYDNVPQGFMCPAFISIYNVSFLILPSSDGLNSLCLEKIECVTLRLWSFCFYSLGTPPSGRKGCSDYWRVRGSMEVNQASPLDSQHWLPSSKWGQMRWFSPRWTTDPTTPGCAPVETKRITQLIPNHISDSQNCEEIWINGCCFKPLWF